jgi:methionyl-tRNA synthetase
MSKYLVTSALPYANGPIHLGHLAGAYLPADVFVRFRKINRDDVVFICGSDEHGVPITIRAEKDCVTPRDVVNKYHLEFKKTFQNLGIEFDNFSGTSRPKHYEISQKFFRDLNKNGHISVHTEKQFYDESKKRFLPDRYVEGICPHCGYDKARGDQCDKCGKLLDPMDLIQPKSVLSGEKPLIKETKHWYLKLQDFEEKLKTWISSKKNWKYNVKNFVLGWIGTEGLKERAITRDLNWGIPVPLEEAAGKVLYVWFDAPIGYISSTVEWGENLGKPDRWKDYWLDPETKLVHFIGKDNIPFHAIIWPAMLMGQNTPYILPYDIPANEYLTLEGEKLSTSQNWAVWADEYLASFPPDPLRYFLAANAPESKDSDFSWKAFQTRNNEELANILGNFVNRTLTFVQNNLGGIIPEGKYGQEENKIFAALEEKIKNIVECFASYKVREATQLLMDIARIGNKYFDETKPWVLKKENPDKLSTVMNICVNILRMLSVTMYPIIPFSAQKLWKMIGETGSIMEEKWDSLSGKRVKAGQKLGALEILFTKYEDKLIQEQIDRLLDKSKRKEASMEEEGKKSVTIEEFKKFDLRVAEILEASPLEKSNKLLKLKVKVGEQEKQILAGIKAFYQPEELIGKKVIIINNLEPAKLMGELSEGMVLAASNDDKSKVIVLSPVSDIESGAKVS